MDNQYDANEILDLCILAGKIILESGGETNRVEDTMIRMAAAFGKKESHSFSCQRLLFFH